MISRRIFYALQALSQPDAHLPDVYIADEI